MFNWKATRDLPLSISSLIHFPQFLWNILASEGTRMNFPVYEYIFEETRVLKMISRPWLETGGRDFFLIVCWSQMEMIGKFQITQEMWLRLCSVGPKGGHFIVCPSMVPPFAFRKLILLKESGSFRFTRTFERQPSWLAWSQHGHVTMTSSIEKQNVSSLSLVVTWGPQPRPSYQMGTPEVCNGKLDSVSSPSCKQ